MSLTPNDPAGTNHEFLDFVNCDPSEVQNVPADRGVKQPRHKPKLQRSRSQKRKSRRSVVRHRATRQDSYWSAKPTKVWRPRHP